MTRTFAAGLAGAWAIAAGISPSAANEMGIGRTAILSGTLPASTTWQVEQEQTAGVWLGTGVLVPGRGSLATVRMDGWSGEKAYRFRRNDGAATVTASVGTGWHLAGEAPEASQVMIESSANLMTWSQTTLLYPEAGTGRYVRVLPEPLGARQFFRSEAPALPVGDATVTSHTTEPPYPGSAGFGPIYDDMPQIYKDGYIGALSPTEYHRGGQNAAAAGECFELAGPFGRTTLMISNLTDAPPGTVDVGRSFFDIGPIPYAVMSGGPSTGALTAAVRLVPAPVTGNVKFFVPTSSSPFYVEFRPYNYRAGVSKLEIQNNGSSTWIELPRSAFNSFVFSGGSVPQLLFPLQVRVTSRFGEVVNFPPVGSLTADQRVRGLAQFTVFPELAPIPEHRLRPAYHDELTEVPGDTWSAGTFGGSSITESDSSVAYAGTASLRMTGLGGFAGVTFSNYPAFNRPGYGELKLAIRSASPVAAGQVGLWIFGSNTLGGSQVSSSYMLFPPLTTTWQIFRFPLEASGAPPIIWGFGISGAIAGALPNVWIDEVEVLSH